MLRAGRSQRVNGRSEFGEETAEREMEGIARRRKPQSSTGSLKKLESKILGQLGNSTTDGTMS